MDKQDLDYKRSLAKELYLYSPYTQSQIAEKIEVSQQTLSVWKEKYGWGDLKEQLLEMADQKIKNYGMISSLFSKELEKGAKANVDKLTKIASLMDKFNIKENIATEIEKVGITFMRYIEEKMPEKSEFLLRIFHDFAVWYDKQ